MVRRNRSVNLLLFYWFCHVLRIFAYFLFASCGKEFLDVKTNVALVIPTSVEDYQRILDNGLALMNGHQSYRLAIVGSDEHYFEDDYWDSFYYATDLIEKYAYVWAKEVYYNETVDDWNNAYNRILTTNIVLDALGRMDKDENSTKEWKEAKGAALFFRAYNYYQLAQLFCPPYYKETANTELGLPLRLESDLEETLTRSSLYGTYEQILTDLYSALELLPDRGDVKMRPSKAACYGVLARVYLRMDDYQKAADYAHNALIIHNGLLNFNGLDPESFYPFSLDYGESNSEVLFGSYCKVSAAKDRNRMAVDTILLNKYENFDLRKEIYYLNNTGNRFIFRGSYWGNVVPFVGVTTSELLLVYAECLIRKGEVNLAMEQLNKLRSHRFLDGKHAEVMISDPQEALKFVLDERRRELALGDYDGRI